MTSECKTAAQGLPFFYPLTPQLKRFSCDASYQIWPAFRYSSSKKSPVPAVPHKKVFLTKSDKNM
ncbi:hypothetical protein AL515_23235 [Citrobacter sp. FDAARGOS_156]|nr:hypothetical protein AL515_23235 [Citrobacter sp. FDAARGOS_156]AYL62566.1 hypothetical protein CUC49_13410 [Citrobacter pasteurii]